MPENLDQKNSEYGYFLKQCTALEVIVKSLAKTLKETIFVKQHTLLDYIFVKTSSPAGTWRCKNISFWLYIGGDVR